MRPVEPRVARSFAVVIVCFENFLVDFFLLAASRLFGGVFLLGFYLFSFSVASLLSALVLMICLAHGAVSARPSD